MSEVATAYVTILPSARGFKKRLEGELSTGGIDSVGTDQGKKIGSKLSGALGGVMKVGMKAGVAGAVATAGVALVKGFSRLSAIDQATARLRGLKLTGEEITGVMDSATKAVTGTAYGLDSAATAASGALGAGVKQGEALTKYLTLVGDATTQSTTDFNSMALMMNKVQGQGKLTGEVMQQMAENGLQVMPMLAKEFGKPVSEIQKMVSKGEISAERFQKVLQKNIGGAAQESGKTFSGAMANTGAALGRLGAKLLGGVFPKIAPMLMKLTGILDKAGPVAERLGGQIADGLVKTFDLVGQVTGAIVPKVQSFFAMFSQSGGGGQASAVFTLLKSTISSFYTYMTTVIPAIVALARKLWEIFGPTVMTYVKNGLGAVVTIVTGALNVIQGVLRTATAILRGDWKGAWDGIKQIVRGALGIVKGVVQAGFNLIRGIFSAAKTALVGIMNAAWAGVVAAVSSGVVKAVQLAVNLKSKILGALSGAKTWLSNVGEDIMNGLLKGIERGFEWIKSKLSGVGRLIPGWLKKVLGIASPSKVMADEVGRWIPAGIAAGIDKGAPQITDAMTRASDGLVGPSATLARPVGATLAPHSTSGAATRPMTERQLIRALAQVIGGMTVHDQNGRSLRLTTTAGV